MVIYLFLLLLLPPIIILFITAAKPRPSPPLPPGPKPWPIIGNLLQLSKKPHISLAAFSKLHGPLISLRLGSQLIVVASSPAAAVEILRTHDLLLSARFISTITPFSIADLDRKAIIWASSCNENWKNFRSIFKIQLFSAKAIEAQAAVRERKAAEMVNFVGSRAGEEIDVGEVAFATVFDSLSNLIFSRDCIGFEESAAATLLELGAAPNLADFFPVLEKLDPQGLIRENARKVDELFSVWKTYVKERRENRILRRGDDAAGGDFLDIFLENGLDDDQIDWLNLVSETAKHPNPNFGAGRRMCPGTPLAARQIPLILANLVWNFDWGLPKSVESAAELDMEEKFGITLQKELSLVLVPRRPSSSSE
ncbi:(S)-N-methylcoclaurine 3'-hydroxylase isozyme 2 [Linum perenne]